MVLVAGSNPKLLNAPVKAMVANISAELAAHPFRRWRLRTHRSPFLPQALK
jgi:hypothetical protein